MNAGELKLVMADNAQTIAEHLLPQGKKASGEWKAGSVSGEEGKSLSVKVAGSKKGLWSDFATRQGGDLLDLWMACRNVTLPEAMKEAKAFLAIRDDMPEPPKKAYKRPAKPLCKPAKNRAWEWLEARGIESATRDAFHIAERVEHGKTYAVFPYLRDGEFINAKYRNPDDKHDMRQEGGAEPCLFGWHLVEPNTRKVAIAEGEIDAMTLWQAGIPALSVNAGAGNHQWIESDWERLDRFDEIWLCYDNDEAGNKGAKEVANRLGVERCKRVIFPGAKDANEYLLSGACGEDFWNCIHDAKTLDPSEMASYAAFGERVVSMFYPAPDERQDPMLVLGAMRYDWFRFRPSEYTVWTGYNGHGKSMMLSQVVLGLMRQGERVMVFSGEMPPDVQLKRMVKQATGMDRPSMQYIRAAYEWIGKRAWVYDKVGSEKLSRILEVFNYAARRYGITQFVIDSLMMLADVPSDGPGFISKQQEAVQKMTDFAKKNRVHVHLVAHPRKGDDETRGPGKMDVGGSGKITDAADNVFTVWSARKDESQPDDGKPDGKLELHKQRNGDRQHMKVWLYFNRDCQQFLPDSERRPVPVIEFSGQPEVLRQEESA